MEERKKVRVRRKKRVPRQRRSRKKFLVYLCIIVVLCILGGIIAFAVSHSSGNKAQTATSSSFEKKDTVPTVPLHDMNDTTPIYILVVGRDQSQPAETDSLFLLGVSPINKRIDVIGIPSNTKIESRDKKRISPIHTMYATGGISLTKAVVEDMFHISIPYYVILDKSSFYDVLSIAGTPDMYVEMNMNHTDATTGKEDINLKRGIQSMDPDKAYQYVRYIDSESNSFDRTQREERFMKSFFSQEMSEPTFSKMWLIWRVWSHFDTNLSTKDAMHLIWSLSDVTFKDIHFFTLPGTREDIDGKMYWNMDPTGAQRLVGVMLGNINENDLIAPPVQDSKNKKLDADSSTSKTSTDAKDTASDTKKNKDGI